MSRARNGNHRHALIMITVGRAHFGEPRKSMGASEMPRVGDEEVHDPVAGVEHPAPEDGDDDRRNDPREDDPGPREAPAPESLVQRKRRREGQEVCTTAPPIAQIMLLPNAILNSASPSTMA